MIESAQSPSGRTGTEPQGARSWRLGLALLLFTFGILLTCIRFPPADLTGRIAQTLGVPFFFAALLFGGAAVILHAPNSRHRAFRVVSLIAAIASAIIGVFTTATFV